MNTKDSQLEVKRKIRRKEDSDMRQTVWSGQGTVCRGNERKRGSKWKNLKQGNAQFNIVNMVNSTYEGFKNLLPDSEYMQTQILRYRVTKT